MKGYRFYEEFMNKNKESEESLGNVIAVFLKPSKGGGTPYGYWGSSGWLWECLSAIYLHANSDVSVSGVSPQYLTENCKRISEEKARQIHPKLFERLEG